MAGYKVRSETLDLINSTVFDGIQVVASGYPLFSLSRTIHVWYIYIRLVDFYGKHR